MKLNFKHKVARSARMRLRTKTSNVVNKICRTNFSGLTVHLHCIETGPEQVQGQGPGLIVIINCAETFAAVQDRDRNLELTVILLKTSQLGWFFKEGKTVLTRFK